MTNGTQTTTQQAERIDTYYEFFPSVRRGYRPSRTYDPSSPSLTGRSRFPVSLRVQGRNKQNGEWEDADTQPSVDVRMYGPGDVAGIDKRQIVRVEPAPDTTTFPPNYFPLIEFAQPDMPWLFSPERANPAESGTLRPWLCLVVVEKDHDKVEIEADGTRPLPALTAPPDQLPPLEECWAWAHTQVVGRLSHQELTTVFTGESNQAVSRLLCPRNLDPNSRYLAAVVPTFEPGRRTGLGNPPFENTGSSGSKPTIAPAWTGSETTVTLPVYHQWEFTTSSRGDFEALARTLEPRQLDDHDVGVREVDMSDPGPAPLAEGAGLTRAVGGALQSPGLDVEPYPETVDGADRKKRLALRNLLNNPGGTGSQSSLPTVGPPIYGQWYVPAQSGGNSTGRPEPAAVPVEGSTYFDSWLHTLNVDPRYRIAAGYGTEVIQENQESLLETAWERFGSLKRANEDAGRSQVGEVTGDRLRDRFESLGDEVVGFAPRVRDHEEVKREIGSAGQLDDSTTVDEVGPSTGAVTGGASATGRAGIGSDGRFDQSVTDQFRTQPVDDSLVATTSGNQQPIGDDTNFVSDGVGTVSTSSSPELSQVESLTSGSFRRLTRRGGKLDRGVETEPGSGQLFTDALANPVRHDSVGRLGSRFAGAGDTGVGSEQQAADELAGRDEPAGDADGPVVSRSQRATWRLDDAGNVLSLSTAVDRLDAPLVTVPKALIAIESSRDYLDAARTEVRTLRRRLRELDRAAGASTSADGTGSRDRSGQTETDTVETLRAAVQSMVTAAPTVSERCHAIRRDTFDTLDRQVSKLVAAEPEAVSDALTADRVDTLLERCVEAHNRLVTAVDEVETDLRSDGTAHAALVGRVDDALSAIDDLEAILDRIDRQIVPGTAGAETSGGQSTAAVGAQSTAAVGAQSTPAVGAQSTADSGTRTEPEPAMQTLSGTGPSLDQLGSVRTALLDGADGLPGALDAGGWTRQRAAWRLTSAITSRRYPLSKIMAAPEFDRPMYEPLAELSEQYLLPGVDDIPKNTIGALETNRAFVEAYMAGLNHEMGRELLWRQYPTDRRGTYFRQFWEYVGDQDRTDVTKLHTWQQNALGDNGPSAVDENRVVLVLRGDLLRAYPSTRIYAVKAVKEQTADGWDRVPLLEQLRTRAIEERENGRRETLTAYDRSTLSQDAWDPKEPIFEGRLDPDVTFLGFDLQTKQAAGQQLPENPSATNSQLGWFFVLEERVGEPRFGLDVPSDADYGTVPYGLEHGPKNSRTMKKMPLEEYEQGEEAGWQALSWGHLVDSASDLDGKTHVDVRGDNPGGGDGQPWSITVPANGDQRWTKSGAPSAAWTNADEATWGKNSAHMARITWQQPARVCIHADDILPSLAGGQSGQGAPLRYVFSGGD